MKRFTSYFIVIWAIIALCITGAVLLITHGYDHSAIPFILIAFVLFIVGVNTHPNDIYRRGES